MSYVRIALLGSIVCLLAFSVVAIEVGATSNAQVIDATTADDLKQPRDARQSATIAGGTFADISGEPVHAIGDAIWLVERAERFSLIVGHDDDFLVAYHTDRADPTEVSLVGMSAQELMKQIEGGDPNPVPIECESDQHVCHCNASSDQTCSGVTINSWTCCDRGELCTCDVAKLGDCIAAIGANCM